MGIGERDEIGIGKELVIDLVNDFVDVYLLGHTYIFAAIFDLNQASLLSHRISLD